MKSLRRFLRRKAQAITVTASVLLILYGVGRLLTGSAIYANYWGGLVFAPFAIVIGALALFVATFHFDRLITPRRDKKGRAIHLPAEEFRKW